MTPLRYPINVTLDGCCCHQDAEFPPDEESIQHWTAQLERADALLFRPGDLRDDGVAEAGYGHVAQLDG